MFGGEVLKGVQAEIFLPYGKNGEKRKMVFSSLKEEGWFFNN